MAPDPYSAFGKIVATGNPLPEVSKNLVAGEKLESKRYCEPKPADLPAIYRLLGSDPPNRCHWYWLY